MSRIRFLHIPKTAGSTFTNILFRQYRGKGYFNFTGDSALDTAQFLALTDEEKAQVALFIGHAPIDTGIAEADTATILTVLREPVARVRSFCQHVAEGKSPHLRARFPPESFNLDHFLASGNAELTNLQTKMLINHGEAASGRRLNSMSVTVAKEAALENLFREVAYFGLQEYFDESLLLFRAALGWSLPFYVSLNTRREDHLLEFQERHIARIVELNAIDIEVYQSAKAKFHLLLKEQMSAEEVTRFRDLQGAIADRPRLSSRHAT